MKALVFLPFVAVALIMAPVFQVSAVAATTLLQLSSDPYTNATSQHQTEVGPATFTFGNTLVSAFQTGVFFDGGASNIGFATSTDDGNTFVHGFLPGSTTFATPAGPYDRASDPSVAFDARHGVWLISYLGIHQPPGQPTGVVDVLVSRSTDGGHTWGTPVVSSNNRTNDKNWTVCDNTATSPFYGNCYTEFDITSQRNLVQMSTSTDGGLTWSAAQATADAFHGIGGQPLVQPNGNVVVPIAGSAAGGGFVVAAFRSTDGGNTWGAVGTVASGQFRKPVGGAFRLSIPLPSAAIDASGKIYVVWSDCRFEATCTANDVVLSTSTDGLTWSSVTRVPLDPLGSGVDHFLPGLAVDRSTSGNSAHLGLTFYDLPVANCTVATCQLDVGFSTSSDGGATWTTNTQIAGPMALSWLALTNQGLTVGDYISTSFAGSLAFPVFAVAVAPPTPGAFNEAIFTVQGGLGDADLALSQPANLTVNATSPAGARVTYALPTVSDPNDTTLPTPSCAPASGATFAIGTTMVTCTVTDTDDTPSTVRTTFTVTAKGAAEQLSDLQTAVHGVGPGTSLTTKVQAAQTALAAGDSAGACGTLADFIAEVQAQSDKSIPAAQAQPLVASATRIRMVLGCG